jgi:pSer/pThr/pTyr-binding forkhead associated (FHA) protein
MSASPQAWLLDESGRRTDLTGNFTVGRAPANTMSINDPDQRVSQYHARFEQDGNGRFALEDRHSTNGTFVNERRITRRELADGDKIRFGSRVVYTFKCPEHRGASQAASESYIEVTSRGYEEHEYWFLIGDVKGSSELARTLESALFARLLTDWASRCRDATEPHGGTMANRTGDGWLILFQADIEGTAKRLATALVGLKAMQKQSKPAFRVSIHRGKAMLGGGVRAGEENVLSAELHQAFRMEKIAAKLKEDMVASAAAALELQKVLKCSLLPGEHELPGFAGMHKFYRVE